MLNQLHLLGDQYDEWVHSPVDRNLRIFDNSFLEMMTKTPWYRPFIVWLPIILYLIIIEMKFTSGLTQDYFYLNMNVCFGVMSITFYEYMTHRYLFHMKVGESLIVKKIHFVAHGYHHKVPFDEMRQSFMFPAATSSMILVFCINYTLSLYFSFVNPRMMTFGLIIGYLINEVIHRYLHFGQPQPSNKILFKLKRHHIQHHFGNHDKGYGVLSTIFDKAFNSELHMKPLKT
jgi:sterol desaturase/sphingolipid hydroxylase (fatty acid hydroxylase superfamily)